ncbi:hypothetical protein BDR04DRAFT_1038336, partial [Suillus decipiens]
VFDAQWLLKFDGDLFMRFINESWTTDAFLEYRVCVRVSYYDIPLMCRKIM